MLIGDILTIDLNSRKISWQPCESSMADLYLGGRGLGIALLRKHLDRKADPFSPENPIILAPGLLAGTKMISSSRLHIVSRSPLTGLLGTSNGGGDAAEALAQCGITAVILTGKSEEPVWIHIENRKCTIESAASIWGFSTGDCEAHLCSQAGNHKAQIVCIGPAGENGCAFASVMTGEGHYAGRTGIGAVMGAKRVKAIGVFPPHKVLRKSSPRGKAAVDRYFAKVKQSPFYNRFKTVGSTYLVSWADEKGAGSACNRNAAQFEHIRGVSWAAREDIIKKHKGCARCPIRCKADVLIDKGRFKGKTMERPDFEPLISWGSGCGNADGAFSVVLHNRCNQWGVDSIEAANLVAFAMDLYQRGILTTADTGGLVLEWGNAEAMEKLLEQIVFQTSALGKLLAQGIVPAARTLGQNSVSYAFHSKGLTMTAMDPRGFKGTALGYAVSARGADFCYVYAKPEYVISPEMATRIYGTAEAAQRLSEAGKPQMVKMSMCATAVVDALGICKILQNSLLFDPELNSLGELLTELTDMPLTASTLFEIGERIVTAERLFNITMGAAADDDTLPQKFLTEPLTMEDGQSSVVHLKPMLKEFYRLMNWDAKGRPRLEKLKALKIV